MRTTCRHVGDATWHHSNCEENWRETIRPVAALLHHWVGAVPDAGAPFYQTYETPDP
jgi:hypothetical protein